MSFGIVYLMMFLFSLKDIIAYGWEGFGNLSRMLILLLLFFLFLGVIAYLILSGLNGWRYIVLFEMDEEKIAHIQLPKQVKKAEAIGILTSLAGIASKNVTTIGIGLNASSKSSTTSEFKNVERVIGSRRFNTIKVNQLLDHNQIYVYTEDYDFVWNYITERCTKAKIS